MTRLPKPPVYSAELTVLLQALSPSPLNCVPLQARHDEPAAFDWDGLFGLASRHGVWPLLWRWMENWPAGTVPPSVQAQLREQQQRVALQNLRLTGELCVLLELFSTHGITAIPIKGPTLAMAAYADVAGRQFDDLDLLVARQDVARASELLQHQGYELSLAWVATQDLRFLDVTYDLEFFHPTKGLLVELHWELFPAYLGFAFPWSRLREHLITVSPGGKPLPTLGAADLLIYVCAHAAKHRWPTLKSVADLAWLLQAQAPWDWETLLADARRRNLERVTLLGVLLAKILLGADVPTWVEERAGRQRGFLRLLTLTLAGLLEPAPPPASMARQFRYFLHLQPNWRAQGAYLLRVLTAPNVGDWQWWPLSKCWHSLYVLLRPLRLLRQRLRQRLAAR